MILHPISILSIFQVSAQYIYILHYISAFYQQFRIKIDDFL